jgi:alkylation response protein AidB-like acyl-CoA dehydrogenase
MSIIEMERIKCKITSQHLDVQSRARNIITEENISKYIDPVSGFVTRELWHYLGKNQLLGLSVAKEYTGPGIDILAGVMIKEELAKLPDNGLSLGFHVHNDVGCTWITNSYNEEAKRTLLPQAILGNLLFCTCYTEADKTIPAIINQAGDKYILNAHKGFSVNGLNADICLVTAEFEGQSATIFVKKDSPGISISKTHDRLGNRMIDQVNIVFEDVVLERQNFLTKGGIQRLLLWNKVMTNARFFVALDAYYLLKKLRDRYYQNIIDKQVLGQAIGEFGLYKNFGRELRFTVEQVEAYLADTLLKLLDGKNVLIEEAKIKHFAVENLISLADRCCEVEGGYGYMHDGLFSNIFLQALGLRFSSGSQIVLNEIISNDFNIKAKLAG